jgi:hypothetical protein
LVINDSETIKVTQQMLSQGGLAVKTYQSDLYNNWINTDWIDGVGGINEISSVDTTGDSFTIDALNLAQKVYKLLNRIAISGGSYDDWLKAVYTAERRHGIEEPVYQGSLIRELAFQEVVSTAGSSIDGQALGTLAGRGRLTQKNKGGNITVKCEEPCYIMGIVSLTPRLDYSQGNDWDMLLTNMDDLHKPELDAIGFQDLITDQFAFLDTQINFTPNQDTVFKTVGKVPAWINYMTDVNRCYGDFADENKTMFMTLNRRYDFDINLSPARGVSDLSTYIDPRKYNYVFADTALDSQNFWVQISNKNIVRRKMSAKVIPNL